MITLAELELSHIKSNLTMPGAEMLASLMVVTIVNSLLITKSYCHMFAGYVCA